MSAGSVVFARLANETPAGTRVYPLLMPQQPTYPAVTYQQVSSVRVSAMGEDAALVRVRLQVNAWAKTYSEARALADAIAQRLARYRGSLAGSEVHDVFLTNEVETIDPDTLTRRVAQDYTLLLSEAMTD